MTNTNEVEIIKDINYNYLESVAYGYPFLNQHFSARRLLGWSKEQVLITAVYDLLIRWINCQMQLNHLQNQIEQDKTR